MHTTTPLRRRVGRSARWTVVLAALAGASLGLTACGSSRAALPKGVVAVLAAEDQYGSVASQVGGRYVQVTSVENNPNVDPHNYEASPSVAAQVASAGVVIQNGVGYDSWINKLESATTSSTRKIVVAQALLGWPDSTPNPHLWYDPATMPLVANAVATDLAGLEPAHAAYFRARARRFDEELGPWLAAISSFKRRDAGVTAATTEPVADYLLQAMGIHNLTPFAFQADIMNGNDPTPQDVALEDGLFSNHSVKIFAYNEQVVDSLTESIRANAQGAGVPIVGVYETMPNGYDYQRWMLAETAAIARAVADGTSTPHL
jgi:zinc/manganese transport system substrate-binding protein